jgi:nitrate reductase alpha subunit
MRTFYTEARYRGARVAAVAPDYAEYVKFADTWLPARAGTDAALAMAMTHVIVKEFYVDRTGALFHRLRQAVHRSAICGGARHQRGDTHAPVGSCGPRTWGKTNNAQWKTVVVRCGQW